MAISMSPKGNFGFFQKIGAFAVDSAEKLVTTHGATVEVQFQALKVSHGVKTWMHPMPVNSTAVIKGIVPVEMHGQLRHGVDLFLAKCLSTIEGKPVYAPPPPLAVDLGLGYPPFSPGPTPKSVLHWNTDGGLPKDNTVPAGKNQSFKEMMAEVDVAAAKVKLTGIPEFGVAQVNAGDNPLGIDITVNSLAKNYPEKILAAAAKLPPPMYSGTGNAIALKDATLLNQPVLGSSPGSVYKVIALGERIKMAARLKGTQLSVRVEGPINLVEKVALAELGFQYHSAGEYMSEHFELGTVPVERVMGCLFFHDKLKFVHIVPSLKGVI
jgi:hypothetical protein